MMQAWRPHEAARIKTGKYAGLVGEVVEVRPNAVRVSIRGVNNGEKVDALLWLKVGQLERPQ